MIFSAVPDLVGMLLMMSVLGWLRRKYSDQSVDLWLLGLLLILIENASAALFRSGLLHSGAHVVALDTYLLAGVTFGWAARQDSLPGLSHLAHFLLPAGPMLMLSTLYGLELTTIMPYLVISLASLALGSLFLLFRLSVSPGMRAGLLAVHFAIWVPSVLLAHAGHLRGLVYWGLTCLYLLVAFSFRRRVRRGQIGGLVIVAGFTAWALCFFIHPLTHGRSVLDPLVEQIWTTQKFVVILGMLLTLLEAETERRKAEAMHDALTGLPNRRLFDDRLSQALERSLRTARSAALFLLDLDHFKAINDTHGHAAGDVALRAAAQELQLKVRSSDTLARCGGDEFCIIVNDLGRREDCERIARALREAVARVAAPGWNLSASVGYALFPEDAVNDKQLFALADRRMYEGKAAASVRKESPALPLSPSPARQASLLVERGVR